MVETKREKAIRYFFIFVIFIMVVTALYLRDHKMKRIANVDGPVQPLAAIIHKSQGEEDNPIVALYEYKENKHILAFYEIERMNKNYFDTLCAVTLRKSPREIVKDRKEKGIWVRLDDKWFFFNRFLQKEDRSIKQKGSQEEVTYTMEKGEKGTHIILPDNKSFHLDSSEEILNIYALSEQGDLWLLITTRNVKIVKV